MTTPRRQFRPGPGTFIFIGIVVLLVADRNSRNVLKFLKTRVNSEVERIRENTDALKSSLKDERPVSEGPKPE